MRPRHSVPPHNPSTLQPLQQSLRQAPLLRLRRLAELSYCLPLTVRRHQQPAAVESVSHTSLMRQEETRMRGLAHKRSTQAMVFWVRFKLRRSSHRMRSPLLTESASLTRGRARGSLSRSPRASSARIFSATAHVPAQYHQVL